MQLYCEYRHHMILTTILPDDLEVQNRSPEFDFVEAAIRAGRHSSEHIRQVILEDISRVLNCKASALSFLFKEDANHQDANHQDSSHQMAQMLQLPDFRILLDHNYNEAAE